MARFIWLVVIVLVVYVFGSEAWKTFQQASKPQHKVHSEF